MPVANSYDSDMDEVFPQRKRLPHEVPSWVADGATFFITLNARCRGGAPLLERDRPTRLWESACQQMEAGRWWPSLFLVMPDHVHLTACFPRTPGMKAMIREWKRWTALTLRIEWQRDFFDHRIRHAKEYEEKAVYIRQNPVRKGLVAEARDWPHVWENPSPMG
jgi:putative transposase